MTGSPASFFSSSPSYSICSSPTSSFSTSPFSGSGTRSSTKSISHSPTTAAPITTINYTHGRFQQPHRNHGRILSAISTTPPRSIRAPTRSNSNTSSSGFSTPPLTPDDGSYSSSGSFNSLSLESAPAGPGTKPNAQSKDALDYLMTIFPKEGLQALPHSKGVLISTPTLGTEYEGFVLDLPGQPKTLYVDGKNSASVNLRERYVPSAPICLALSSTNVGRIMMVTCFTFIWIRYSHVFFCPDVVSWHY